MRCIRCGKVKFARRQIGDLANEKKLKSLSLLAHVESALGVRIKHDSRVNPNFYILESEILRQTLMEGLLNQLHDSQLSLVQVYDLRIGHWQLTDL
jgi:hypothetical protein